MNFEENLNEHLRNTLNISEKNLIAKYPTPSRILEAMEAGTRLSDRIFQLMEKEFMCETEQAEFDTIKTLLEETHNKIFQYAIEDNHMLTLVQSHIFIMDLEDGELNAITGIATFEDQMDKHPSKLFDEALIETLIANGIDTASRFDDLLEAYFCMKDIQDSSNYAPVDESLMRFIGFETDEDITINFDFVPTDETGKPLINENTGSVIRFEAGVTAMIFEAGVTVTEDDLRSLQNVHGPSIADMIMSALEFQLDNSVIDEDYERAIVLRDRLASLAN